GATSSTVPAFPGLGFADNPAAHFSRPTAVHRCYASGAAQPVSTSEQREYCLTDGFRTCPRFVEVTAVASPRFTVTGGERVEPVAVAASQSRPVESRRSGPTVRRRPPGLLVALLIALVFAAVLVTAFFAMVRPRLDVPWIATPPEPGARVIPAPAEVLPTSTSPGAGSSN